MRRTGRVLGSGLLVLALAVAGCGGRHGGNRVATAGSPTRAAASPTAGNLSEHDRALRYAQCMRDNGVPQFPDPQFDQGGGMTITLPDGADRAKVDAAQAKCKQYLPTNGGDSKKVDPHAIEQLRQFAQCMREHGITKFPDPTDNGLQVDNNALGVNPDSPEFAAAQQACAKFQPVPPSGGAGVGTRVGGN